MLCTRFCIWSTSLYKIDEDEAQTALFKESSYRAVNTFHLGYKNRSVYAVSGTSRCLFSDKYKKHKYSVGRPYNCWMLNCWCITWPVGFKRLIWYRMEALNYLQLTSSESTPRCTTFNLCTPYSLTFPSVGDVSDWCKLICRWELEVIRSRLREW